MQHPLLRLILLGLTVACVTDTETEETGEACLPVDASATSCPHPDDVDLLELQHPSDCDNEMVEMLATDLPEVRPSVFQTGGAGCCYEVLMVDRSPDSECIVGRPYRHRGRVLSASTASVAGAAGCWAALARAEHASVAAFARLQLQLLAHGAPAALLDGVARAMADEVRHAQAAFAVASRLAGRSLRAGPFPFPEVVVPRVTLAELASEAVRDGCLGETLSALATRRAAERATHPGLQRILEGIADDEDRHAALSWAIVAWALSAGGAEVDDSVRAAFAEPLAWTAHTDRHDLERIGLLGPAAMEAVISEGLREVIAPGATRLLAA